MINLLPPENKRQLGASRANTLLLRYNIFLLSALGFMLLAIGVTYVFLTNTQAAAEKTVLDNQAEVSEYAEVQAKEKQFRDNLTTAKFVLDKEIIYTRTVLAISKLLPSGVVLENLSLDAQTFDTQTTLSVQAKDIPTAVSLKNSLASSSLFSNVHFASIQSSTSGGSYPVAVSLNVTINKEAALRDPNEATTQPPEQAPVPGVSP